MKNIVFDVGMVLIDFRWHAYMKDKGISEEIIEEIGNKIIKSTLWEELDLGAADESDIIKRMRLCIPEYEKELDLFWDNPVEMVREFDYSYSMIESLKKEGYNVYLLSNYPEIMYNLQWPSFSFLNLMDGIVVSSLEKCVKPDEEIYKILLKRYALEPSETCFIDDRMENVETANRLGITGILFKGYEELKKEFENIGIKGL